jgi:hypothetical protein
MHRMVLYSHSERVVVIAKWAPAAWIMVLINAWCMHWIRSYKWHNLVNTSDSGNDFIIQKSYVMRSVSKALHITQIDIVVVL